MSAAPEASGEYRSLEVIAQFLNITPRRVQQLASEGVIPKGKHGQYHFVGAVRGYIKYLQQRAEGRSTADAPAIEQRERLSRLQADRVEMELQERRGELISRSGVEAALSVKLIAAAEQFQGIPDRLSAVLAAETRAEVIHRNLTDEIRNAMEIISSGATRH